MSAEVAQVLRDARRLIEHPASWIKGEYEGRIGGRDCFCAVGAVRRAAPNLALRNKAEFRLDMETPQQVAQDYNDAPSTDHSAVLAWFDRAIAIAAAS